MAEHTHYAGGTVVRTGYATGAVVAECPDYAEAPLWAVYLMDRATEAVQESPYASGFGSYAEARAWADRQEMECRRAGLTLVVRQYTPE
jgi:hypothetical protein